MPERIYRWRDASGKGLEHLELVETEQGKAIRSALVTGDHHAFVYAAELEPDWRTRSLSVAALGGAPALSLGSDGAGHWTIGADAAPELDGALDIDLSASPFTNTLPIRRLDLAIGQSAEILTAFVRFPELTVERDEQRYTRLSEQSYRYQAVDGSFERTITVDPDGFVVSYPGLFERVAI
jgi:hypothetical protein